MLDPLPSLPRIPIEKMEETITQIFQKESSNKKSTVKGSPISVERVTREGYVISIPIVAKDAESFLSIRDKINRSIVSENQKNAHVQQ
ncbi:MAG: hypothetical protein FJY86_04035 [Candidatus Diapherotrites archaeon]|uniref:Uncharacterized protein n=1 Tax=Candidatus Iainarchaeum sp. TaxID=3101447 RepID=A0A8T4CC18_9ARCH|nr:hypothetical protein [Candidatus Diapherotrites archaeon]